MADQGKSKGRAYLVKELRKHGVSRRWAVRILDVIFREMSRALKRGEEVEFPFGKLKRIRYPASRYSYLIEDWPAGGTGYTVIHLLDGVGERLLNGLAATGISPPEGREIGK